jgi:hypothetical protein
MPDYASNFSSKYQPRIFETPLDSTVHWVMECVIIELVLVSHLSVGHPRLVTFVSHDRFSTPLRVALVYLSVPQARPTYWTITYNRTVREAGGPRLIPFPGK